MKGNHKVLCKTIRKKGQTSSYEKVNEKLIKKILFLYSAFVSHVGIKQFQLILNSLFNIPSLLYFSGGQNSELCRVYIICITGKHVL